MLDLDAVGPFLEVAEGPDHELAGAALDVLSRLPLASGVRRRAERELLARLDLLVKSEAAPDTTSQVIEAAGRLGTAGALDSLRRLAGDPDASVRAEASRVLAQRGDSIAPGALVDRLLEEPTAGAAESLAALTLDDAQLGRLSEVRCDDFDVRFWLALAQARAGNGEPLLGVLRELERGKAPPPTVLWGDPWSAERRLAAVRPLPPAILAVLRTLAEGSVAEDVQKVCWWLTGDRDAEGFEKVAPEDRELRGRELRGRAPAAPRFGKLDPDAAGKVLSDALSRLPRHGPGAGNQVIELSTELPAKVNLPVDQLLDLAWSDSPLTPRQTAWILGRQGLDEAIPRLGRLMLETPDPSTRRRVIDMAGLVAAHAGAEPPFEGAGPAIGAEESLAVPVMPAPEATRRAWPHLDAPDVAVVDIAFELEVGLREDPAPGLAVSGPVELPPGPVEVRVSVMAHGFVLDGSPELALQVTASDPYPRRSLTLTARADPELADERRIYAIYSVGAASRAVAERTIRVVASTDEASVESAAGSPVPPDDPGLDLRQPERTLEADLTIAIARGNDAARVGLVWSLPAAAVDLPPPPEAEEERTSSLGSQPEDFLAEIVKKGSETTDPFDLYVWLTGTGRAIARKIPRFVKEAIRTAVEARAPEPATILVKSEEPHVPWEMAVLDELSDDPSASPFLGARVRIGRWPLSAPPPPADPPKGVTVERAVAVSGVYDGVPSWKRLPQAEKEAEEVIDRCGGGDSIAPGFRDVIASLGGDPCGQVLHFALHGRFEDGAARSGLVLLAPHPTVAGEVTEKFLQPQHVLGVKMPHHPFVFLNACQVGAGAELLGDYGGLAAGFIFAGASAVIAPLWSVSDEVAHRFALDFYDQALGDDVPPAEVLRRRRANLGEERVKSLQQGDGSLTLLAYQLYGHPRYTLTRAAAGEPAPTSRKV